MFHFLVLLCFIFSTLYYTYLSVYETVLLCYLWCFLKLWTETITDSLMVREREREERSKEVRERNVAQRNSDWKMTKKERECQCPLCIELLALLHCFALRVVCVCVCVHEWVSEWVSECVRVCVRDCVCACHSELLIHRSPKGMGY